MGSEIKRFDMPFETDKSTRTNLKHRNSCAALLTPIVLEGGGGRGYDKNTIFVYLKVLMFAQ